MSLTGITDNSEGIVSLCHHSRNLRLQEGKLRGTLLWTEGEPARARAQEAWKGLSYRLRGNRAFSDSEQQAPVTQRLPKSWLGGSRSRLLSMGCAWLGVSTLGH